MTSTSTRLAGKVPGRHDRATIRALLPFLWPAGSVGLGVRVVLAIAFLVAAKMINVTVPFFYKWAVDALSGDVGAVVVVPVGILVG